MGKLHRKLTRPRVKRRLKTWEKRENAAAKSRKTGEKIKSMKHADIIMSGLKMKSLGLEHDEYESNSEWEDIPGTEEVIFPEKLSTQPPDTTIDGTPIITMKQFNNKRRRPVTKKARRKHERAIQKAISHADAAEHRRSKTKIRAKQRRAVWLAED